MRKTVYYKSANIEDVVSGLSDYKLIKTGYSVQVITTDRRILISNSRTSRKVFMYGRALTSAISKAPEIDTIGRNQIAFNEFSQMVSEGKSFRPEAFCVDIKSAYLSCLKNEGIIPYDLFKKVNRLKKFDRLKCVGMLATQKIIFDYKNGKLFDYSVEADHRSRNYFMLVCKIIGDIMTEIASASAGDFLFFWVDGMYFKTEAAAIKATEILKSKGYQYTFDRLTQFVIDNKEAHAYIQFKKWSEKKKREELKMFRISKNVHTFENNSYVRNLIKEAEATLRFNTVATIYQTVNQKKIK